MRFILKEFRVKRVWLVLLLFSLFLPAILSSCNTIEEKEIDMDIKTSIPTIDEEVPARIETATFSLG
jgi:hypothetical protein